MRSLLGLMVPTGLIASALITLPPQIQPGGGPNPTKAQYLLQIANGALPNAQALGAQPNGLVRNTTGTGVQSAAELSGDATTSGSAAVTVVATHLSAPLPLAQGGTGASSLASANVAVTSGTLGQFAPTTSAQLAGVLSDETGTGFVVYSISPALTTPTLGVASAITLNKVTITAPAAGATLTIPDGVTLNAGAGGTLGSNAFTSTAYLVQGASPTITSGFGSSPAIDAGYASSFIVTIGSGGTASTGVVGLPTAAVGWVCQVENVDNPIPTTSITVAASYTTSSVTFTNYTIATGVALGWTAGNHLRVTCFPH